MGRNALLAGAVCALVATPGPASASRIPWLRYAWASVLGLSLLGLTYVLFDPDLGTSAPLLGEFTCRGRLHIEVANGFGEPFLRPPSSAVYFKATREGETIAVYLTLWVRERGEDWQVALSRTDDPSEGYIFIPRVTENTEAYVSAKDVEGQACAGESVVLLTNATATAASSPLASGSP